MGEDGYGRGQRSRTFKEQPTTADQPPDVRPWSAAWQTVRWADLADLDVLTGIPCFRDAGLLAIASMCVVGLGVGAATRARHVARAANWGAGAGLLGAIFGWEQCRWRRRREIDAIQRAQARRRQRALKHVKDDQ